MLRSTCPRTSSLPATDPLPQRRQPRTGRAGERSATADRQPVAPCRVDGPVERVRQQMQVVGEQAGRLVAHLGVTSGEVEFVDPALEFRETYPQAEGAPCVRSGRR